MEGRRLLSRFVFEFPLNGVNQSNDHQDGLCALEGIFSHSESQ